MFRSEREQRVRLPNSWLLSHTPRSRAHRLQSLAKPGFGGQMQWYRHAPESRPSTSAQQLPRLGSRCARHCNSRSTGSRTWAAACFGKRPLLSILPHSGLCRGVLCRPCRLP